MFNYFNEINFKYNFEYTTYDPLNVIAWIKFLCLHLNS